MRAPFGWAALASRVRVSVASAFLALSKKWALQIFLSIALFAVPFHAAAQAQSGKDATGTASPQSDANQTSTIGVQPPLTDRERTLLDRIQNLEKRLSALESKVSPAPGAAAAATETSVVPASSKEQTPSATTSESQSKEKPSKYEEWKK